MALSPLVSVSSVQFSRDCLMMGIATGVLGFTFGVSAGRRGLQPAQDRGDVCVGVQRARPSSRRWE